MIVPEEEMGVGFEATRQRKGKWLSQDRVMFFSGLGVFLRQKKEGNPIIGLYFPSFRVGPQVVTYGEGQKEK